VTAPTARPAAPPTGKPVLLDAYCGAGGAARGYQLAGFYVVGVDIAPQPRYAGDEFYVGEAIEFIRRHGREFDAIHASPPCQRYSTATSRNRRAIHRAHPDLLPATRAALVAVERPYVIENVPGAPIHGTIMLCGSSFGLDVRRHRWFESSVMLFGLPCQHDRQAPRFRSLDSRRVGKLAAVVGVHGSVNYAGEFAIRCRAMGIDWMTNAELTQAIPPAYCEHVGAQVLRALGKAT
jgi:hypothetical protein